MMTRQQQTVLVAACIAVLLASFPSADANLLKKNNRPGKAEGQMGEYCGRMISIALTPWTPIDYDEEEVKGCWGAPDEETQIPPAWGIDRPDSVEGDGYNFCMSQAMKQMNFEPFDRANQMCNKAYSRDQVRYERRMCNLAAITRVLCPWEFQTTCDHDLSTPTPAETTQAPESTPTQTPGNEPQPEPEPQPQPERPVTWFMGRR